MVIATQLYEVQKSKNTEIYTLKGWTWEFPGGPVVRNLQFHCWCSFPGWWNKIPQASQCGQKKKEKGELYVCELYSNKVVIKILFW